MVTEEKNKVEVYGALNQKIARLFHLLKAKYKSREKAKIIWLSQFMPEKPVIFDIGANMGHFAKEFAKLSGGNSFVYSFEPVGYNFSILKDVTSSLKNVKLENLALSDENGSQTIYIPIKSKGKIGPALAHFGLEKERHYVAEEITTVKMDDYVMNNSIENVDFIKCDVEGAEMLVFKGGNETISKFKPTIFCEIDGNMTTRVGYSADDVFSYLISFGYTVYKVGFGHLALEKVSVYDGPADYLFKQD